MPHKEDYEIDRPVFQSQVPPYLQGKLSESEAYMVSQISIMEQSVRWAIDEIISLKKDNSVLNEDVAALKSWKEFFSGKYAVIAFIGTSLLSAGAGAYAMHILGIK